MKFEKLNLDLKNESKLAMPNELFTKLLELKEDKTIKSNHAPFIYSYLYLNAYLYRYSIYETYVPSTSDIKEMLGMSKGTKTVDYIIKKDGLLDKLGLTYSTKDYPIHTMWVDEDGNKLERPQFNMLKEESNKINELFHGDLDEIQVAFGAKSYELAYRKKHNLLNNQYCKLPVFAFYRDVDDFFETETIDYLSVDGTFYESNNTTIIPFEVFQFCMENEDLGVTAFYIYAYLKHKGDLHQNGYDASHKRLSKELGLSEKTIQTYRNAMRSHNMIHLKHNMTHYSPNVEDRKVSTNIVQPPVKFTLEQVEYNKFNNKGGKSKVVECEIDDLLAGNDRFKTKIIEFNIDDLPY